MSGFQVVPPSEGEPAPAKGFQKVPAKGEYRKVPEVKPEGYVPPDASNPLANMFLRMWNWGLESADAHKKNRKRTIAEALIKDSVSGALIKNIASGGLEAIDRISSAWFQGQRIMVRHARGESTADMIQPMEILTNTDFRDDELNSFKGEVNQSIASELMLTGEKTRAEVRPGAKELIKEIVDKRMFDRMASEPYSLFGIPLKWDGFQNTVRQMQGKEIILEDGQTSPMISELDVSRMWLNLTDDPFLAFGATETIASRGSRGVRNLRHFTGLEEVEKLASKIESTVEGVKPGTFEDFRKFTLSRLIKKGDSTLDLANIPPETARKFVTHGFDDLIDQGIPLPAVWENLDNELTSYLKGDGELNENFIETLKGFQDDILDSTLPLEDNVAKLRKSHNDLSFDAALDAAIGSPSFNSLVDNLAEIGTQVPELSYLRRLRGVGLGDNLSAGSITNRPIFMTPNGRVVYMPANRGEAINAFEDPAVRTLYRILTGRSIGAKVPGRSDVHNVYDRVAYVSSRVVQPTVSTGEGTVVADGRPTLEFNFKIPTLPPVNDTGRKSGTRIGELGNFTYDASDRFVRETLIDNIEEMIFAVGSSSRAHKFAAAVDVKNARLVAADMAEAKLYQLQGINPTEEAVSRMGRRRATIDAGKRVTEKFSGKNREALATKISKIREQAAVKAEKDLVDKHKADAFNFKAVIDIDSHRVGKPRRREVLIQSGEETTMARDNRDLRFVVNSRTQRRHMTVHTDEDTAEILYRAQKEDYMRTMEDANRRFNTGKHSTFEDAVKAAEAARGEESLARLDGVAKQLMEDDISLTKDEALNKARDLSKSNNFDAYLFSKDEQAMYLRAQSEIKPTTGQAFGKEENVTGSVDDVLEELLTDGPAAERTTDKLGGSGGGSPPKPVSDDVLPPMPPYSIRPVGDITLLGWLRDPQKVLGGTGIFEELASGELGYIRSMEAITASVNSRMYWLKAGSDSDARIARFLAGKTSGVDGKALNLTDREQEAAEVFKRIMDDITEASGKPKSDDIRVYMANVFKGAFKKTEKIAPELLEAKVSGNYFYAHLLPDSKKVQATDEWSIVNAFRVFVGAGSRQVHIEPAIKKALAMAAEQELGPNKRTYLSDLIDRLQGKPHRWDRKLNEALDATINNVGLNRVIGEHSGGLHVKGVQQTRDIAKEEIIDELVSGSELSVADAKGKLANKSRARNRLGVNIVPTMKMVDSATKLSMGITRQLYRGMLGGSLGFTLKNTAQIINTVADVGPLDTLKGVAKMTTKSGRQTARDQKVLTEFVGMLEEVNAGGQLDRLLFKPAHASEFLNRGIAYHAGVSAEMARIRKLNPHLSKRDIMDNARLALRLQIAGHTVAQRTQFMYGILGRSPIFGSAVGRIGGQFMTFPIKQTEFLVEQLMKDPTGFARYLAMTGYSSRILSDVGVDPTGFIGFGFLPQEAEKGSIFPMAAGVQMGYHLLRASMARAEGDLDEVSMRLGQVRKDFIHMIPGGLQADKWATAAQRSQTLEITSATGSLVRELTYKEMAIKWLSLPTINERNARLLMNDIRKTQKREQFSRSYIIGQLLDRVESNSEENLQRASRGQKPKALRDDLMFNKLISQANAWGLNISSQAVQRAAARRELSSYLRAMEGDKRTAVHFWNKYLADMPNEAARLNLEPIKFQLPNSSGNQ